MICKKPKWENGWTHSWVWKAFDNAKVIVLTPTVVTFKSFDLSGINARGCKLVLTGVQK